MQGDFLLDVSTAEGEREEHACSTLFECIVTTLNHGLRSGGGIGDVLRPTAPADANHSARVVFDMAFFFLMIVINMNLILGIIIDTFADLRKEKQDKDDLRRNSCFVCGLPRQVFDGKGANFFERHCKEEHNLWSYVNFVVLLRTKDQTEFTGQESYVSALLAETPTNLTWFPRMMAMSLKEDTAHDEHDLMRRLAEKLEKATAATEDLNARLLQLQQNMAVQRKEATRTDMQQKQAERPNGIGPHTHAQEQQQPGHQVQTSLPAPLGRSQVPNLTSSPPLPRRTL
jgi:inositol 1,4,5-triphosphate receptor type 1